MPLFQIGETFQTRYIFGTTASLALDTDGTLVTLGGATGRGSVLEVTRLESDGSVISQNVVNTTRPTESPTGATLQVLTNGNLVALYSDTVRVFDANGDPITPMLDIPFTDFGSPNFTFRYWLSANPLTGGFSVIVGSDDTLRNQFGDVLPGANFSTRSSQQDVRIAEFDANGRLVRDPFLANYDGGDVLSWIGPQIAARHTTLADGRVVIAYNDQFYNVVPANPPFAPTVFGGNGISVVVLKDGVRQADFAVYVPPLDDEGEAFTNPQSIASRPPVVVPSSLGGYAVLYASGGTWWARFYDGSNTVESDPILLSGVSGVGTNNGPPQVAMMSGGRIAVLSSNAVGASAGDHNLTVLDKNGVIDFIHVATIPGGSGVTTAADLVIGDDETIYVTVGHNGPTTVYRFGLSEGVIVPGVDGKATGTSGNDVMIGGAEDNRFVGRGGSDRLEGQDGADRLLGRNGKDHIQGNDGDDVVDGGGGDDEVHGGSGNDTVRGGAGDDLLTGGLGDDTILGGAGIDTLSYQRAGGGVVVNLLQTGRDVGGGEGIDTFAGIENLLGSRFGDRLFGTAGDNAIDGDLGDDTIEGRGGRDTIEGGAGDDTLRGQGGNDALRGGDGNDTLDGGSGNDLLKGGAGADNFVFDVGMGNDRIVGFDLLGDNLLISTALAGGMTAAQIEAAASVVAAGVSIDFGAGDTLLLLGLTSSTGLATAIDIG